MLIKKYIFTLVSLAIFSSVTSCKAQSDINIGGEKESLNISVYGNNLALVRDVRAINVPVGIGDMAFEDIPETVIPETVNVASLKDASGFSVIRQQYTNELIDQDKLLDEYIGKKVRIMTFNEYHDRKETVEAELLSNRGSKILKIGDEIFLGYPGYIILPEIPEGFKIKPELSWVYDNKISGDQKIEVTYLTRGVTWKADYVMFLDEEDTAASVDCWATIRNNSGFSYQNASVRIVAGEIRQEENRAMKTARYAMDMASASLSSGASEQSSFFEYHIYDVPGTMTLTNDRELQAKLFSGKGVSVNKEYEARGTYVYYNRSYEAEALTLPVTVKLKFMNDKKNGLGIPFPEGTIRVYKKDSASNAVFLGGDSIKNIAENEKVEISLGTAFDITVEKKQTEYKQLSKNLYESGWEITLRNNKDEDVTVNLIETLQGNWSIIEESQSYEKIDAYRIKFAVIVEAGRSKDVSYKVSVGI